MKSLCKNLKYTVLVDLSIFCTATTDSVDLSVCVSNYTLSVYN